MVESRFEVVDFERVVVVCVSAKVLDLALRYSLETIVLCLLVGRSVAILICSECTNLDSSCGDCSVWIYDYCDEWNVTVLLPGLQPMTFSCLSVCLDISGKFVMYS